jgi:hypothetical protein
MDLKELFTDSLHKINPKDIRGKEVFFWFILVLNLFGFFLNIFEADLFFLVSLAGVLLMMVALNNYYKHER